MRKKAFALRNIKELLRDPLSYLFCLGFPIIMLLIMTAINQSIPHIPGSPEIFSIGRLTPAVAVFGLTFVMQFAGMQVSKDRASTFLLRLYASPMKSEDYIAGYTLSLSVIGIAQIFITYICGAIVALMLGTSFDIINSAVSVIILIPSIFLFIGIGFIIGAVFNDKAAPAVSSILITIASLLGGIWMDVEVLDGVWKTICGIFPFYHSVKAARCTLSGDFEGMIVPFFICAAFAAVIYIIAVLVFAGKIKSDKK